MIIEPEVLPPEDEGKKKSRMGKRLESAFGPIAAGLIIDTLDVATFGSFGLMVGPVIGGSAAFWMCSIYKMPVWQRLLWAIAAGLYCGFPRTEFIPMATMIGAFARFMQSRDR